MNAPIHRRAFAAPLPIIGRPRAEGVGNAPDVNALVRMFEAFASEAQASTGRLSSIETSIDEITTSIAALRLNGGGGGPDPANSRKAMTAFGLFAKTGKPDAMRELLPQSAMSTDDDSKGGYLVPEEVGRQIVGRQLDFSPMRRLASVIVTASTTYEQLVNAGGSTASWVGERQSRPETNPAALQRLSFPAHEIYANPSVSQTLLDDSAFDVAAFVTGTIAEDFDQKEGDAFINGDGVNKPRGLLQYSTPTTQVDSARAFGTLQYVATGVAAALIDSTHNGIDALTDLVYALRAGYRRNATWLMNSKTAGVIRKLKSKTDEQYLWQNSVAAGQPPTLLGYPVEFDESMPDVGAGAFPVAFGDFKRGYLITDRIGTRILRDPFTNKPFVMFYTTKRVGGGLLHSDAIKLLKVAAS